MEPIAPLRLRRSVESSSLGSVRWASSRSRSHRDSNRLYPKTEISIRTTLLMFLFVGAASPDERRLQPRNIMYLDAMRKHNKLQSTVAGRSEQLADTSSSALDQPLGCGFAGLLAPFIEMPHACKLPLSVPNAALIVNVLRCVCVGVEIALLQRRPRPRAPTSVAPCSNDNRQRPGRCSSDMALQRAAALSLRMFCRHTRRSDTQRHYK